MKFSPRSLKRGPCWLLKCSGSQRPQFLCGKMWLMPNSFILNSLQLNNFWQLSQPFLGVRSTGYFIWMFSLACQVEELDYHYIPINQALFTKYYRWAKKEHCKAIHCFCCCNGWPFSHYTIVHWKLRNFKVKFQWFPRAQTVSELIWPSVTQINPWNLYSKNSPFSNKLRVTLPETAFGKGKAMGSTNHTASYSCLNVHMASPEKHQAMNNPFLRSWYIWSIPTKIIFLFCPQCMWN